MIYSVRGKILHKSADMAVVECGGVGYACRTTLSTLSKIGRPGDEVMLYTYLHVREDNVISVSGVGPKAGLAILSDTNPERFALTVATGDYKVFTKTKGVGPKLAQRVVLELKDKISKEQLGGSVGSEVFYEAPAEGGSASEAIAALVVLGYSQTEAASAVAKLDPALPVEEMIKQALKKMAANL